MNDWGLIPMKLKRELGQWWKCNMVVFGLLDFVKRDSVSKFSRGEDDTS